MSVTVFLALCILGMDFLIYALFEWTYGEKRSALARRIAAHREAVKEQAPRPFVVASQRRVSEGSGTQDKGGRIAKIARVSVDSRDSFASGLRSRWRNAELRRGSGVINDFKEESR